MSSINRSADPTAAWLGYYSSRQRFEDPPSRGADARAGVRVVCVSDTHGKHRDVAVPPGDVLVHAGDFTNTGETSQVADFHAWMSEQPHPVKICIAGNHDTTMHREYYESRGALRFHPWRKSGPYDVGETRAILTESETVVYLEDSEFVINAESLPPGRLPPGGSLRVWGSPWSPEFCDWAFNLERGPQCRERWQRCPGGGAIDLLITHGPPLGRGDNCEGGHRAGCVDLLEEIQERIVPAAHVFGHVHEGYGVSSDGVTVYVNASSCTFKYRAENPAIVFELVAMPEEEPAEESEVPWKEDTAACDEKYPEKEKCKARWRAVHLRSAIHDWSVEEVQAWLAAEGDGKREEEPQLFTEPVRTALAQLNGSSLAALNSETIGVLLGDSAGMSSIRGRLDLIQAIRRLEASLYPKI